MSVLGLIILFTILILPGYEAKHKMVNYVATERAQTFFYNKTYFSYGNFSSTRRGRHDVVYYVHLFMAPLVPMDNNVTINFYFYEFLSNEYRRGFVEIHQKWCDLLEKDLIFGTALKSQMPPCPQPPGEYYLRDMTIPEVPLLSTFPFKKGRIYMNATYGKDKVRFAEGCIDMEIKQKRV